MNIKKISTNIGNVVGGRGNNQVKFYYCVFKTYKHVLEVFITAVVVNITYVHDIVVNQLSTSHLICVKLFQK